MPNHVTTELTAPAEVLRQLLNDGGKLDFNMLIPQPENIETDGCSFGSGLYVDVDTNYLTHTDTGKVCWYEWNVKYWGTKWNGYELVYEEGSDRLTFETAWAHPYPVVQALSAANPGVVITVRYADEDLGQNVGTYWLMSGTESDYRLLAGKPEGYELASELRYGMPFGEKVAEWVEDDPDWELSGYYTEALRTYRMMQVPYPEAQQARENNA